MSNLFYRTKNNNLSYFIYNADLFVHKNYSCNNNFVHEYEIIQKIQENEEHFFDFSKSIIDIGACFGQYSMLLNFKHNYCFEPNKNFFAILYTNTYLKDKLNNTDNYNVILSDKEEKLFFNGFNSFVEMSDAFYNINETTDKYNYIQSLDAKVLDSFNIQNVGFIKIDVEGFEEKVIRGGLLTIISNKYPPILFECWDVGYCGMTQEKRDSLFSLLKTLGYEIFEYWGDFETHLAVHKTQLNKNNQ